VPQLKEVGDSGRLYTKLDIKAIIQTVDEFI
jgi:hypothetical protein